ncbi:MAG: T9SS type A sorting domain-containing protein [Fibrobacter sp.]|nr:T9SS type A sorting domain-containing protein [Fibrobacter sp.]
MNRVLCLCFGVLLSISTAFAVEWVKESNEFEFPGTSVKYYNQSANGMRLTTKLLPGKRLLVKYNLPGVTTDAVLNIYSINGAKVSSFKLTQKASSITWNAKELSSGAFTAELKTENAKKTVRFIMAN